MTSRVSVMFVSSDCMQNGKYCCGISETRESITSHYLDLKYIQIVASHAGAVAQR